MSASQSPADLQQQQAAELQKEWDTNPRWKGVQRTYTAGDVVRLRGSVQVEHAFTLERRTNGETEM